jgi:hypothetical protein
MVDEALDLTTRKLVARWPLVREIVRKLMKEGFITGEQFQEMEGAAINRRVVALRKAPKTCRLALIKTDQE